MVQVRNVSRDVVFNVGKECGVARDAAGNVLSVSAEAPLGELAPGDTAIAELRFSDGAAITLGQVEAHARASGVVVERFNPDGSRLIDTGPFSVTLPPGWTYIRRQGIDSFIGELSDASGARITFDYGWYSDPLVFSDGFRTPYEDDPRYSVINETVDGLPARIVTPRFAAPGLTGMYIANADPSEPSGGPVRTALGMYAYDLGDEKKREVLSIYRSVDFNAW
jgi:hypothetical protein